MSITGEMLIGASAVRGREGAFRAVDPGSGRELDPPFGGASQADVERACALAWAAFDPYRATGPDARARFLETAASRILDIGYALIERAAA